VAAGGIAQAFIHGALHAAVPPLLRATAIDTIAAVTSSQSRIKPRAGRGYTFRQLLERRERL